jgi:hypothetical protein
LPFRGLCRREASGLLGRGETAIDPRSRMLGDLSHRSIAGGAAVTDLPQS